MRWFFRYELEHALARAGFVIEALNGDFDRSEFGDDSGEMIFVAKPAPEPEEALGGLVAADS